MKSLHPGFKKVADMISKKSGISNAGAGAILANKTRNASTAAKKKNPRLKMVAGCAIFLTFLLYTPLHAQNLQNRFFFAYDHEAITVANSAIGFTSTKYLPNSSSPTGAQAVGVTVECATGTSCPFRFFVDGTTASTSVGTLLDYQASFIIYGFDNIKKFSTIRSSSTSAVLQVVYYR